jgi:hypothetical protein
VNERDNQPEEEAPKADPSTKERESSGAPALAKIEPAQITEAIEKMPTPVREIFEMMAVSTMAAPNHPLLDKFKDEHVKQFLDNDRVETVNDYKLRSSNRFFHLMYIVISLFALGLLIWFLLPQNKDLLTDLLKIILAFAGGVTSGFGLKAQLDKKKAD